MAYGRQFGLGHCIFDLYSISKEDWPMMSIDEQAGRESVRTKGIVI